MNMITCIPQPICGHPERGDIFKSPNSEHYYILAFVNGYVLVDLCDGCWYSTPKPTALAALNVEDGNKFQFVGRDVKITIDNSPSKS